VKGWILGGIFLALVSWNSGPSFADGLVGKSGSLAALVFHYLDSADAEEAERVLRDI